MKRCKSKHEVAGKKAHLKGIVKDLIKSIQAQRKANTNLSSILTRFLRKSGYRFIEKYGFALRISLKNFQQAVVSEIWMIDWQLLGQKESSCGR